MGKIILQKQLLQVFQLGYFPSTAKGLVVAVQSLSRVWLVATSRTSAHQAPLFSTTFWVQFSPLVTSDSLQPHGLQHARLSCSSPIPGVYSNSCPLIIWWCHPTISLSTAPFSFCPPSFPASGSFPMSQLFVSSGQGIGTSASTLPVNIQGWSCSPWMGPSRVFSSTTI